MICQLSIRNIALIDTLDVAFEKGLNAMTGETGAGKSIVVGSVDFVLGGRADKDRIAEGAAKGQVEALFDITDMPRVKAVLAEMEIEAEDGLLSVAREITQQGRSVSRVGGVVVPLAQLKRVTSLLVDLHGQHQHQSLLDPATHLAFLDQMGDGAHRARVEAVQAAHERWAAAKRALDQAEAGAMERARREDMLRFQLEELDGAKLVPGEEDALEQQRLTLRNAERIREGLERAYAYVSGGVGEDAPAALDALRVAAKALDSLSRYGDAYAKASEQVYESLYALEAVAGDLDALRDEAESDPDKLEAVEARLDLLSRLRRKYGATSADMIAYREQVREELSASENADERREKLTREEADARQALNQAAEALSAARQALAKECAKRVMAELDDLGMRGARFEARFDRLPQPGRDGLDAVEFLLSANVGEPMRPLARVASGGELSRIMLAFKCIEADSEGIGVMVFDEIDTGISGRMGQVVADKMHSAARGRQVLCVTHLPQIAARADAQYLVEKYEKDGRTHTTVTPLDSEGRADAIARMLGGGETALAHARAMLDSANKD